MGMYNIEAYAPGSRYVVRQELNHGFRPTDSVTLIQRSYLWMPLRVGYQRKVPCLWLLEWKITHFQEMGDTPDVVELNNPAQQLAWQQPSMERYVHLFETGEEIIIPQNVCDWRYLGILHHTNLDDRDGYRYNCHAWMV